MPLGLVQVGGFWWKSSDLSEYSDVDQFEEGFREVLRWLTDDVYCQREDLAYIVKRVLSD